MDTSVFVTQTQIEKIKGEAQHVFACFYDGLFLSCLEMLIHAPAGITLLPLYAINGRNITSVIVHFFSICLWCWVFEEQSGHNFLASRYKSVPVSAKVGHESKLQSKLNATTLPPSPTHMRCSKAPTPFFSFFNRGERPLPCHSARPLIGLSGYPQILFPDGGKIGSQRLGLPQTLSVWRPPLISYLMEVL